MKKISAKRILLGLIVAVGISLVGNVGILVWGSWITPFEKQSMLIALDQMDELERYSGADGNEYKRLDSAARESMDRCRRRAITEYDHRLLDLISMQLDSAELIASARLKDLGDVRFQPRQVELEKVYQDSDAMLRSHLE